MGTSMPVMSCSAAQRAASEKLVAGIHHHRGGNGQHHAANIATANISEGILTADIPEISMHYHIIETTLDDSNASTHYSTHAL